MAPRFPDTMGCRFSLRYVVAGFLMVCNKGGVTLCGFGRVLNNSASLLHQPVHVGAAKSQTSVNATLIDLMASKFIAGVNTTFHH